MGFKIWNYGTLYLLQVSEKWCYRRILYILQKHVPIRSPKYNQKGQCNVCGQPITFRSVGKSGRFCTKWYRVYLIQRRRKTSGFVLGSFMPERGIKGAAIQIAKLPAMKSREESSLQMERNFQFRL